ncbi:KH domain-containing, RNA-binding, signal transduction-associated protein [Dirofilaria immitis]
MEKKRNISTLLIVLSAIATVQSYDWRYSSYGYGFRRGYYDATYNGFTPYGGGWFSSTGGGTRYNGFGFGKKK